MAATDTKEDSPTWSSDAPWFQHLTTTLDAEKTLDLVLKTPEASLKSSQSNESLRDPEPEAGLGASPDVSGPDVDAHGYLAGLRLWLLSGVIAVMLFLVSLDTTIVTTSLVPITEELGGFQTASWVLSAYQLGWVAVIAICAKFSDIFGRKPVFVVCIFLFMVFSAGCAGSHTMEQLIILRAFQGIGGGGCFALTTIMMTEVVAPEKIGGYASRINIAVIMSMVLGPLLGGAISSHTTWRWIFWINVPISAIALILAIIGIPKGFPNHGEYELRQVVGGPLLARIDPIGSLFLLAGTVTFAACFQEAGSEFAWDSAYVVTLLIVSLSLWVLLLFWERHISVYGKTCEPILPWGILTNRITAAVLFDFVLVGVPLVATNFELPQRFQLVNGLSSIDSGLRILPFGISFVFGSIIGSQLTAKLKLASIYQLLIGAALQSAGYALLSTLHVSDGVEPAVYGYQVLCGIGAGISSVVLYLLVPHTLEKQDRAVGLGLASQFRTMGSIFGLAIMTAVFNGYTSSRLASLGFSANLTSIQSSAEGANGSASSLPSDVREILSRGYNDQMLVLLGFSAAQIFVALLLWKRKQIVTA